MATKPLRSLTFPGLSDTYTVAVTDPTLKLTGEPADAKTVGDWLTTADAKATVAEELATDTLYDYDYSTDFDADLTTFMHVTRHGMLVTLNGTVSSNPNGMWLFKLNGTAQYGSSSDPVKAFSDPLVLTEGHTYRFRLRKLSGTIDAVEFKASVIKSGQTVNQGTNTQTGNDYNNDFVYDSTWTGAHICVRFGRSAAASFTNVVLLATLEDLSVQTDEQKDIEELQETSARIDGYYEGLTAGSAEQLLSTIGSEDNVPYVQRSTGGGVAVVNRAVEKIIGGTVAWNQVIDLNEIYKNLAGTISKTGVSIDGTTVTVVHSTTNAWRGERFSNTLTVDHVYLFVMTDSAISISDSTSIGHLCADNTATTKYKTSIIGPTSAMFKAVTSDLFILGWPNATAEYTHTIVSPQLFDLTQMFGSTVADAVYAMEQANTGTGVAWFRAMFPESYYSYNAGELKSVQTSGKRVTGFNLFNKEAAALGKYYQGGGQETANANRGHSDFIRVTPGMRYYTNASAITNVWKVLFFDSAKQYVWRVVSSTFAAPEGAVYMAINFPLTEIDSLVVNISDSTRDGTYEPYSAHTYPFDSSLTLRGIPKWDSSKGAMYYDGDRYESDGRVTRRYEIVDLGTLSWTRNEVSGAFLMRAFPEGIASPATMNDRLTGIVCSAYPCDSIPDVSSSMTNRTIKRYSNGVYIRDDSYTDAATFKSAMSGVFLVYELATPATDPAEPYIGTQWVEAGGTETFLPVDETAVFVPVGHETQYPIDLRGGLETLLNTDLAHSDSIAHAHGDTASTNITTGELLMQNGSLYKATQPIVAGAAITPGINAEATSLADEIKTDATLSIAGDPADAKATGDALAAANAAIAAKADPNGNYEGLTAGSAEQLLSTTGAENMAPYTLRQTGGGVAVGDRAEEKIIGGTIAWNQLNNNYYSTRTVDGVTATKNDDGSWTLTGVCTASNKARITLGNDIGTIDRKDHVMFLDHGRGVETKFGTSTSCGLMIGEGSEPSSFSYAQGAQGRLIKRGSTYSVDHIDARVDEGFDFGDGITIWPQLFDLTQMFGSAVADAVYAMEQATPGAGIAWFRAMFPEKYYTYDAGTLMSVQTSGKRVTGFNAFDKTTTVDGKTINPTSGAITNTSAGWVSDYIAVCPKTQYYLSGMGENLRHFVAYYTADRAFISRSGAVDTPDRSFITPAGCQWILLTQYKFEGQTYADHRDTVCLNIYNTERNGNYEPYTSRLYPLDSSLILRGVPKWDSVKGTMYYDGDEYTSNGRVTWRYGIVDLGTLNWSLSGDGETAFFYTHLTNKIAPGICARYAYGSVGVSNTTNKVFALVGSLLRVRDTDYTDAAAFKASVSGVYLVYEMATTATDPATPYTGAQWVEAGGTEAFIDAGTETGRVAVPVGHDTFYPTDLREGLETLLSPEVTVTGNTATITAERDRRYLCGTVTELAFTPCATGLCEVRFTSGTTPTVLTLPQTVKMPDWWTGVEASTTYEISIADGIYGAVMAWAT